MLQLKARSFLFILCIVGCIRGYNQATPALLNNLRVLDSCEQNLIAGFCQGPITYSATYKDRLIKHDQRFIQLLNIIFDTNATPSGIQQAVDKLGKLKARTEETWNGLIRVEKSRLLATYFTLEYQIESIDSVVIRKKCQLKTFTKSICNGNTYKVPDFKLLRTHLVPLLTFPITMQDNILLFADTLLVPHSPRLTAKYPDYSFTTTTGIPNDWANKLLVDQFNSDSACCYNRMRIQRDILALTGQNRTDVLKLLLYSPSYFYAVQAMEALIYLEHQGKITLTDQLKKRIQLIKQANNPVVTNSTPDVNWMGGYKNFRMTDSEIINKYSFYLNTR